MGEHTKPLPDVTDETRPFWEGLRQGKLRLQRCDSCGHIRYPISFVCPQCLHTGHEWRDMSGRGSVFSYVVFHQIYHKAYAEDVPYNVALIQLDEGPRMFSNVVGAANDQVSVCARVKVVFDPVTDEITLPRFEKVDDD
ncbi:MAG: Zn-ribbon domain-containing OB-fold protein [Micromonosporaceae bacterium]